MNHIASAAAATVMMIGAGAGAVTDVGKSPTAPSMPVMNPMVGGQAMLASRDLIDNIARSPDHTAFVAALRQTGLAEKLSGNEPYTLFAPTNAAFTALTDKAALNKADMARILSYHMVRGKYDSQTLLRVINEGEGKARLKTLAGGTLLAMMNGPTNIILMDEKGQTANIAIYDVYDKNGVTQIIDKVVRPGTITPLSARDLPEAPRS
jgi:uncharacterized surface protein with fasciclin (FAS1) repeats